MNYNILEAIENRDKLSDDIYHKFRSSDLWKAIYDYIVACDGFCWMLPQSYKSELGKIRRYRGSGYAVYLKRNIIRLADALQIEVEIEHNEDDDEPSYYEEYPGVGVYANHHIYIPFNLLHNFSIDNFNDWINVLNEIGICREKERLSRMSCRLKRLGVDMTFRFETTDPDGKVTYVED